jgi:molybdenum cofactor cytidylyltransferase
MKLLADVGGVPLLERTIRSLLAADVSHVVVVVAPQHAIGGVRSLDDPRVTTVVNEDPSRGMFSSIQAGLSSSVGDPIVVLPADMPFVPSDVIAAVVTDAMKHDHVVVPTFEGRRGHPVVIPARLLPALLGAPAQSSLKQALIDASGAPAFELPVDSRGVVRDVDVPGDLYS